LGYLFLKYGHISLALVSVTGFIVRWSLVMNGRPPVSNRLVRSAPHVIDTLFLISGILLAITLGQFPFKNAWLTAKICGLLCYILLGMAAMSSRSSKKARIIAFALALLVFSWIVSVARLKSAWGVFGYLVNWL